ncbi:MAG: MgtC/SapB family protein [Gammaproteobacteria bacterium]|nr:MgtC/SapB family protein [Gammaproteobacteria bacterium]
MEYDYELIFTRLLLAVLAGGIIGIERAIHGREAGFRTHTLVSVSSSLLMLLMVYQWELVPKEFLDTVRADPTRMAQGIMTGIGFLGAGVIIKEGLSVRGLTTAASIWMTAAIGIVIGLGFYVPALIATIITILTLSAFRWLENLLPTQTYARLRIEFKRFDKVTDEATLNEIISAHHIKSFQYNYHLVDEGKRLVYEVTIRSKEQKNFRSLAQHLMDLEDVLEFRINMSS